MNRIILLPLLLLAQPGFGQSLKERIEAEATELVAEMLSDTVQTTLISEGREAKFAACVGRFFASAFKEATDEQRQSRMPSWLEGGKLQCNSLLAAEDASNAVER